MDDFINLGQQAPVNPESARTTIILASGIPWDAGYQHVRKFDNPAQVLTYVRSKKIYETDSASPVKRGRATIAVPINELAADTCNYIAFKNPLQSDKFYFGFVTGIYPLNVNACVVSFVNDAWTNNQFDINFNRSFVVRCHVPKSEDIAGSNIIPDGLETGDYVALNHVRYPDTTDYCYVVASASDIDGSPAQGGIYANVYSGLNMDIYTTPEQVNGYIERLTNADAIDNLVKVFMMPIDFAKPNPDVNTIVMSRPTAEQYGAKYGYTPKNNKCMTYPFVKIHVTNNNGSTCDYKFDSFDTSESCSFTGTCNYDINPTMVLYPNNYMGIAKNYSSAITYSGFPNCAIVTDAFKAWLAQKTSGGVITRAKTALGVHAPVSNAGELLSQASAGASPLDASIARKANVMTGAGGLIPGFMQQWGMSVAAQYGAAKGSGEDVGLFDIAKESLSNVWGNFKANVQDVVQSVLGFVNDALSEADGASGVTSNNANAWLGSDSIDIFVDVVQPEYMQRADNYFTMFGYPQGKLMDINLDARSTYVYIKTVNCGITGNIEMDQLATIRSIFDRGVTVWHVDDVGNYALDND